MKKRNTCSIILPRRKSILTLFIISKHQIFPTNRKNYLSSRTYRETSFIDKNVRSSEEFKVTENKNNLVNNSAFVLSKPVIPEEDSTDMKTLTLKVLEGKSIPIGYKIKIRDSTINGKPTNMKDRFIFGKKAELNDFLLPSEENVGEIQFEIKYNRSKNW